MKNIISSPTIEPLLNVIEHAANGMAIIQEDTEIIVANAPFQAAFQYTDTPLIGFKANQLLHPLQNCLTCKPIQQLILDLDEQQTSHTEVLMVDQSNKQWKITLSYLSSQENEKQYLLVVNPEPLSTAKDQLEQILPEMLRTTSDFVGLADVNCNLLFLNDAARTSLGYTLDEDITNYTAFDLITESESRTISEIARPTALKYGRWEGKTEWKTKNGRAIQVSSVLQVHKDQDGNPAFFSNITRDISAEIEYQKQLEEKEKKYRSLVERITDAYVSLDKDGCFEYINSAAAKMIGADPEPFIGQNAWELFEHAKQFKIYDAYCRAVETQKIQRHFEYFEHNDQWIEFTLYPSTDGLSFYFKNVTELKKAEEQITEMNTRLLMLEKFINQSSDSFQVSDVNGKLVYINRAAENRLGVSADNATDLYVYDIEKLFTSKDAWDKHVEQLKLHKGMTVEGQILNKKTGNVTPMEISARLEEIDGAEYVIAILRDISERVEHQKMISERTKLLEHQNVQLEDFCNMISHNLRAPLANLSMLVELIEKTSEPSQQELLVAQFKPITSRLNTMFSELMESIQVRSISEIHHETIDLKEYIARALKGFSAQMNAKNVAIDIDLEPVHEVIFPPQYMNNLLHNLLSNCFKYAHPDRPLEIAIRTRKKGRHVILAISDNGLGMDLEKYGDQLFQLNRVFHKHPEAKGFGLYITRTQIESVGGRIWATSRLNEGSTFYVEFKPHEL